MAVKWDLVLNVGRGLLLAVVLAAALLPMRRGAGKTLRPLAHVERLTELPEYARAVRIQRALVIATAVAVLATLGCALYAAARPLEVERSGNAGREHPDDVMLCVALPATNPVAAAFLAYYQKRAEAFTSQRIGLTSQTLRVMPLTADHAFASGQLGRFAGLAKLSAAAAEGKQLTEQETKTLADGQDAFSRTVRYSDYQPNFIDTLASCVIGFPDHASPSGRRRSVVYLGPTDERPASGTRTAYSSGGLAQLVQEAKAQINIVQVAPGAGQGTQPQGVAKTETEVSGGKFFAFSDSADPASVAGALDQIRAHRPALTEGAEPEPPEREVDDPTLVLALAIGFATVLSLCLAVIRR
ncbi:hypothetical protein [Segniliparus rugosus]|uniref:von Willebrand factor type A domain-containing protein n=1 Tax=Segniliparus rugosus (strain ATCC BAA-974 / DSM 45345 / CCUG 50838 / CIP 108380 / JCM 13579 / CDC 945) TaxID=679197 RepID=E5XQ46_SEGRC|nr:hypothetical protein [Segniliparus rugosus]EFV13519.1 hypothetical protein HMPREF9336_01618 [Segniliparus rugosus ATCC BAA-974]